MQDPTDIGYWQWQFDSPEFRLFWEKAASLDVPVYIHPSDPVSHDDRSHVDDTARGHLLAMERGKSRETYIIAGPVHTVIEAFEIAEQITGIPAPKRHPGPGLMKTLASFISLFERVLPVPESYSSEYLRTSAGVTYLGSSEKAERARLLCPALSGRISRNTP